MIGYLFVLLFAIWAVFFFKYLSFFIKYFRANKLGARIRSIGERVGRYRSYTVINCDRELKLVDEYTLDQLVMLRQADNDYDGYIDDYDFDRKVLMLLIVIAVFLVLVCALLVYAMVIRVA